MSNIWFTSDTHWGHKNIVRGVSRWEDKGECRDFDTLEEHNEIIVSNINEIVQPDDILYHCGDWSFGGIENVYNFRKLINCKTIHLVLGNHDHHIKNNKIVKCGDTYHNLQTLFSSVNQVLMDKIGGQNMILCHYSMRSWDKGSQGTWMLYGHSHGSLEEYLSDVDDGTGPYEDNGEGRDIFVGKTYIPYKTMDVGMDTHPEFRPFHFDEIAEIMKDRINLNVDHHHAEQSSNFRNRKASDSSVKRTATDKSSNS